MARAKKPQLQLTDQDLVQRKLAGVFNQVKLDIPWSCYDFYATCISDILIEDYDVKLEFVDIVDNPKVKCSYENYIKRQLAELIDCLYDHDDAFRAATTIFTKEIKAEEERQMLLQAQRRAQQALEEEERKKQEARVGTMICVPTKKAKKAQELLKAAGIIK